MLQLCRNWIIFTFARSDVQLQQIRSLSLWSYKACNSFYFASGRWSYIKLWPEFKKTDSFDDVVHFIDEEIMVTCVDFDCGITFFPENPTKFRQVNREQNYSSKSCEKPQCIPSNDQHIWVVDELHSSNIFMNPYNFCDLVPAALLSLCHTNDTYSLFNHYPQPTNQKLRTDSYPVFSSLRTMNSKRKGLRVSFAFFQWNYLPNGRLHETVAKVEELSDLWKPGAMDGTPPFVMNCNCI